MGWGRGACCANRVIGGVIGGHWFKVQVEPWELRKGWIGRSALPHTFPHLPAPPVLPCFRQPGGTGCAGAGAGRFRHAAEGHGQRGRGHGKVPAGGAAVPHMRGGTLQPGRHHQRTATGEQGDEERVKRWVWGTGAGEKGCCALIGGQRAAAILMGGRGNGVRAVWVVRCC